LKDCNENRHKLVSCFFNAVSSRIAIKTHMSATPFTVVGADEVQRG
jgi:hypothetical protein